jgi:hypothetical protein
MLQRPPNGVGAQRPFVAVAAVVLADCGNPTPDIPRHATSIPTHVKPPVNVPDSRPHVTSAPWYDQQAQTDLDLAWYTAARDDSDPRARLQIIDAWARQARPDRSLDLLTNALVDPDETVRARAHELMEQVWAAKAGAR